MTDAPSAGDGPPPPIPTPTGDGSAAAILRAAETLRSSGAAALREVDDRRLEDAFLDAVAAFRDPSSPERRGVDPALRESAALSQGCLDASLAALLDGFSAEEVRRVIAAGRAVAQSRPRLAPSSAHARTASIATTGASPT